jgi:hypothetical protein
MGFTPFEKGVRDLLRETESVLEAILQFVENPS